MVVINEVDEALFCWLGVEKPTSAFDALFFERYVGMATVFLMTEAATTRFMKLCCPVVMSVSNIFALRVSYGKARMDFRFFGIVFLRRGNFSSASKARMKKINNVELRESY